VIPAGGQQGRQGAPLSSIAASPARQFQRTFVLADVHGEILRCGLKNGLMSIDLTPRTGTGTDRETIGITDSVIGTGVGRRVKWTRSRVP